MDVFGRSPLSPQRSIHDVLPPSLLRMFPSESNARTFATAFGSAMARALFHLSSSFRLSHRTCPGFNALSSFQTTLSLPFEPSSNPLSNHPLPFTPPRFLISNRVPIPFQTALSLPFEPGSHPLSNHEWFPFDWIERRRLGGTKDRSHFPSIDIFRIDLDA